MQRKAVPTRAREMRETWDVAEGGLAGSFSAGELVCFVEKRKPYRKRGKGARRTRGENDMMVRRDIVQKDWGRFVPCARQAPSPSFTRGNQQTQGGRRTASGFCAG